MLCGSLDKFTSSTLRNLYTDFYVSWMSLFSQQFTKVPFSTHSSHYCYLISWWLPFCMGWDWCSLFIYVFLWWSDFKHLKCLLTTFVLLMDNYGYILLAFSLIILFGFRCLVVLKFYIIFVYLRYWSEYINIKYFLLFFWPSFCQNNCFLMWKHFKHTNLSYDCFLSCWKPFRKPLSILLMS